MRISLVLLSIGMCIGANSQDVSGHQTEDAVQHVDDGRFLIHGQLNNIEDGVVLNLYEELTGSMLAIVASDTLRNGQFTLSDTVPQGAARKLYIIPEGSGFPNYFLNIWVKPGANIQITGQDKLHPLWKVESNVPEQQTENAIGRQAYDERLRRMQLITEESNWMEDADKLQENWPKVDSLRKLQKPLEKVVLTSELEFMKTIPVDSAWIDTYCHYASLLNAYPYLREPLLSLYPRLSADFISTEKGREVTAYVYPGKVVKEGDDMVDGTLYDLDGNTHHLSEFKGKYILLDFWSQGCGPCIMSIPELERLSETYQDKMAVVSICEDGKKHWQEYVRKRQLKGNQWNELISGRTGLAATYQVRGIPHYVLISPEGKVLKMWSGYGEGSLQIELEKHLH